jgi:hypothetical protein
MLLNICSGYERARCSRIKWHNCRNVVDEKHTSDNIWSFLGFLHSNMVDSPRSIVLLGSNRNIFGSTSRCRGRYNCLRRAGVWIGALVGKVTSLLTSIALPFTLQWVLSNLSPLNTLIPSSRGLKIIGALDYLTLWGRKSLFSCLRLCLELQLSKTEYRSS